MLRRSNTLHDYDAIIQDQFSSGIVEVAPEHASGKEFYIPHRPVVKETSEATNCVLSMIARRMPDQMHE